MSRPLNPALDFINSVLFTSTKRRGLDSKRKSPAFRNSFFHRQFMREYEDTTRRHIPEDSHSLTQPYHLVEPLISPRAVLFTVGSLHPPNLQIFNISCCFQAP